MEDNKQITQGVDTATTSTNEDNKAGKTFTQADMDNLAGKIRGEEKAKNDQAIKEAVAQAIAEERRQAKLTEEEREKEAKSKREAELREREEQITLRENRVKAQELLAKNNIPIDLVDFVVDLDATKMEEKINTLAKTYNKSVETGVTDKLKGNPPKDFSNNNDNGNDKPKYSGTVAF
jgi:crotonobetainyl-CoA:carnitine CoA-transferase CaiB-like acyl-CoA transferase